MVDRQNHPNKNGYSFFFIIIRGYYFFKSLENSKKVNKKIIIEILYFLKVKDNMILINKNVIKTYLYSHFDLKLKLC